METRNSQKSVLPELVPKEPRISCGDSQVWHYLMLLRPEAPHSYCEVREDLFTADSRSFRAPGDKFGVPLDTPKGKAGAAIWLVWRSKHFLDRSTL